MLFSLNRLRLGPTLPACTRNRNRMIAPTLDPADDQFSRELEDLLWFIMKAMDFWENIPSRKEQEAIVGRTRRAVSSRPELDALPEWAVELLSPTVFWPESYMPVPPDFCDRPKPPRSRYQPLPRSPATSLCPRFPATNLCPWSPATSLCPWSSATSLLLYGQ